MKITLKDGSVKEYAEAKAIIDIAYDISEGLARAACAVEVNGEVVDLRTVVDIAAICPGSGKDFMEDAIKVGADVYITGDISHHAGIDAVAQGLMVIDAGHYGIEKIFIPYMKDFVKKQMPGVKVFTEEIKNPFVVI